MKLNFMITIPKCQLHIKTKYEPLLLECLNYITYFIEKSGGGFSAPKSEHNGESDAIGENGYSIDFKCLISQKGAKNLNEISPTKSRLSNGLTAIHPSKASMRGVQKLPFPNLWGFLVNGSLHLNENYEIILADKTEPHMKSTIESLNKMTRKKKNLLFFLCISFKLEDSNNIEMLCGRASSAFKIISNARTKLAAEYETYYALLTICEKIILLSNDGFLIECIDMAVLNSWGNILLDYVSQ